MRLGDRVFLVSREFVKIPSGRHRVLRDAEMVETGRRGRSGVAKLVERGIDAFPALKRW